MIQHRIGRGMAIMPAPMHFAARDHIDSRDLLFQDRGLGRAQLRIGEVSFRELAQRNHAVKRFVPARYAVRSHYRGV
jgi:hypothetical protein